MIDPETGKRIIVEKDNQGRPFIKCSAAALPKLKKALQEAVERGDLELDDIISIIEFDKDGKPNTWGNL